MAGSYLMTLTAFSLSASWGAEAPSGPNSWMRSLSRVLRENLELAIELAMEGAGRSSSPSPRVKPALLDGWGGDAARVHT